MTGSSRPLSILLISGNSASAARLTRHLEAEHGACEINTMTHCKSALAYLRNIGPYKGAKAPDIVFFDCSDADTSCVVALKKLAFSDSPPSLPMVMFTSHSSEPKLIRSMTTGVRGFFSPLDLRHFVQRMRELHRERFLGAMTQLTRCGLIVVRVPECLAGLPALHIPQPQ